MMRRILLNGLLTTLVQIIVYIIILYVCFIIGAVIFEYQNFARVLTGIGFPIIMAVLLLGMLLLVSNLISSLINKVVWTKGLLTIAAIIYCYSWIEDLYNWPWTTVLFLLAGLTTIYLKLFLDKKIEGLVNS